MNNQDIDVPEVVKLITEIGLTIISIIIYRRSTNKINILKELIFGIEKSPILLVDSLKQLFNVTNNMENNFNFKNLEIGTLEISFDALVFGKVLSTNPISSFINNSKQLIFSKLFIETFSSSFGIRRRSNLEIKNQKISSLFLTDQENESKLLTRLHKNLNLDSVLSYIGTKFYQDKAPLIKTLIIKILGFTNLFKSTLSSIEVKKQIVEFGIENGNNLFFYGKVTFDKITKSIKMENPILVFDNLSRKLNSLKSQCLSLKLKRSFSIIVSIIFTIITMKRLIKWYYIIKRKLLNLRQINIMDELKGIKKVFTNSFYCQECKINPVSLIVKPCLHISLCKSCYYEKRIKKCPTCRKNIKKPFNIFLI